MGEWKVQWMDKWMADTYILDEQLNGCRDEWNRLDEWMFEWNHRCHNAVQTCTARLCFPSATIAILSSKKQTLKRQTQIWLSNCLCERIPVSLPGCCRAMSMDHVKVVFDGACVCPALSRSLVLRCLSVSPFCFPCSHCEPCSERRKRLYVQDPLTCKCSCKFTQLQCKSRQLELNERTCRFVYELSLRATCVDLIVLSSGLCMLFICVSSPFSLRMSGLCVHVYDDVACVLRTHTVSYFIVDIFAWCQNLVHCCPALITALYISKQEHWWCTLWCQDIWCWPHKWFTQYI